MLCKRTKLLREWSGNGGSWVQMVRWRRVDLSSISHLVHSTKASMISHPKIRRQM